jgi:hypothetical protein
MDELVMELSDRVAALEAENKRLRAAASHVLDKSSFCNQEELAELGKAFRKLQMELDRFSPSQDPWASRSGTGKAKKAGRRP